MKTGSGTSYSADYIMVTVQSLTVKAGNYRQEMYYQRAQTALRSLCGILPESRIPAFTSHDLRRTTASHMTGMGITRLVVKKILNHAENDVTAVYDRHSYDNEKRHALESWGSHLSNILNNETSSNVVTLKTI